MSEPRLHVLDDPARTIGELLAEQAAAGGDIVLTGGTSIGAAYEHAALCEPDWHRAAIWWGDERCVPPGDVRSNFGLARRTLLDRLERLPVVHRIRGELAPADAASAYEEELADCRLDLLLLSVGSDGHIASLFPGSPQLLEKDRRVTSGHAFLEPFVERVTLTLPALLSATRIVLLVRGAAKAPVLERLVGEVVDPALPASLLRTGEAPIDVYCDRDAASDLRARDAAPD